MSIILDKIAIILLFAAIIGWVGKIIDVIWIMGGAAMAEGDASPRRPPLGAYCTEKLTLLSEVPWSLTTLKVAT